MDSTYTNKEQDKLINDLVGRPFGLLQSLRMKGVGSKRMVIESVSAGLRPYLNMVSDVNYANLELRPKGILVRINKGLKTFTWAIPYHYLVLFKSNVTSIHAQGQFIHFKENRTFRENKNFFKKLMQMKLEHDQSYDFQEQHP